LNAIDCALTRIFLKCGGRHGEQTEETEEILAVEEI
jgi:hypothetical protein